MFLMNIQNMKSSNHLNKLNNMVMLHDFLMFMGGAVLGALLVGCFAYLIFKSIETASYGKGYMDGWDDANKYFQSLKQPKKDYG
jgi:Na+/H+-translocating membrane pyrophosphatase